MPMPVLVLHDREHCDPVVLTQRLHVAKTVRDNLAAKGCTTAGMDSAIETLEDLLAEHLPPLPAERML